MDRPSKRLIDPLKRVERLGERGSGEKRRKVGEEGVSAPSSQDPAPFQFILDKIGAS
jgi:hypothetical protein